MHPLHVLLACGAATPAAAALPFSLTAVASIDAPTAIVTPPSGPDGLYVVEQVGRIWRFDPDQPDKPSLVVDLRDRVTSGGERGLLGLAFAPGYPTDPRAFVNYTYEADGQLRTRIAAYGVSADGATFDPKSEAEILAFDQPYSNHNSGSLAVGPDGMLYIGVGDGGGRGDPKGNGQDLGGWLGSILRIDVTQPPYTVPPDNPFVATEVASKPGALPEIWAYGVRNPWGMHFDRRSDGATLWFADVGQDAWEEVNRGVAGGNYGWNVMEGTHCYEARTCEKAGFVPPVAEYGHDVGHSVTGGVVYRGPSVPALDGRYVYADFVTGRFWAVPTEGGAPNLLGDTELNPSTFGVDRKGRLYVGDYRGTIWRVGP
ncbi:MAG: PQQ-dependent sugar dehydrogenase [Pseudomonadota bacterium]|nr:PQQ-dependent sugar dehydrogenase [Pseudomonadota bacterium]